ncbi:hypothetical protein CHELA20_10004 [Hyphomicrobiales bacterium]|nr:hypothetical protein CHELA20_10004 [Hyphomicrobiales bacterium]CAH1690041.1 hypothetical protein CHELA41_50231 [Hyphomicrobiales bacterium]
MMTRVASPRAERTGFELALPRISPVSVTVHGVLFFYTSRISGLALRVMWGSDQKWSWVSTSQ